MSVVQFGENTVSIVFQNKRYSVRELEIDDDIVNNTKHGSSHLVNVWKNQCLTKKYLSAFQSSFRKDSFFDVVLVEGSVIEIHFELSKTSTGIYKDKRAVALAALQKS